MTAGKLYRNVSVVSGDLPKSATHTVYGSFQRIFEDTIKIENIAISLYDNSNVNVVAV